MDFNGSHISCFGENDGSLYTTYSGGVGGYSVEWTPGMQTTDTTLNNLIAGIYTVTVSDSNNCITQDSIELIEPNLLNTIDSVINVSCFEGNDGEIYLSPTGGTPGYSFILISNG